MRAVLDPNVLISAAISPSGGPAELVRAWQGGRMEIVVSPTLLEELSRAFTYPKLSKLLDEAEAEAIVAALRRQAILLEDPEEPPQVRSRDPGDDYLLALAAEAGAALVSGDRDLLCIEGDLPIFSPADFLVRLARLVPPGS